MAWLWFLSLERISVKKKWQGLQAGWNPQKMYERERVAKPKEEFEALWLAEATYMMEHQIGMITCLDQEYPEKLKQIYDPPLVLFYRGDKSLLQRFAIAVIGCREASLYGRKVAFQMAYDLAKQHTVIISGMAKGIDGVSHAGALHAEGKTIAVLGSGVDYPYPFENRALYQEILLKGGLILSEYRVGTKPIAIHFPQRNRLISALSDGVLVVEAKQKSGTMITVDFALEQGKNVYVIPGNIDSVYSEGTNELVKQGAKVVTKIEDILEE